MWDNEGLTSEKVQLVYRTTPKTLIFERVSDAADFMTFDPSDMGVTFHNNVDFTSINGTGNFQTTADMIADNFEATGLGPITTPGTDDAYVGGYGIMGDRAVAFYVSNVSGPVKLNYGNVHGQAVKLETASGGVIVTGNFEASGNITAKGGGDVYAYDVANQDFISMSHQETYSHITTAGTGGGSVPIRIDPGSTHAVELYNNTVSVFETQRHNADNNTSGAKVKDHNGDFRPVGFNDLKDLAVTADVTLDDIHAGSLLLKTVATAGIDIVLPSSTTTLPSHSIVQFLNAGNSTVTINAANNSRTLYWLDGSTRTGGASTNRTVAYGGVITIFRLDATTYYIWGSGIS